MRGSRPSLELVDLRLATGVVGPAHPPAKLLHGSCSACFLRAEQEASMLTLSN